LPSLPKVPKEHEPGKLADMAVLSQDIFQVPLEDLPKTESVLTMIGGQIAYAVAGSPVTEMRRHPIYANKVTDE